MDRDELIKKEFERLQKGFRNESDPDGKESFGIGFWKAVAVINSLPLADVIGSVSAHIHYDLSLKAMQLMVDKEELTVEEFRELPEVKKLWIAMDVIKEHYL